MTPWELVSKSEHSHQRAVFAWANCAALYGFQVAADPRGYSLDERINWLASNSIQKLNINPVPELARLFAIHNQGHGDKIRGAMARAEGVKPGVPDIMLPVQVAWQHNHPIGWKGHGLFIELKRPKKGKAVAGVISEAQDDWTGYLVNAGYAVVLAVGWIEAANAIARYMGSEVRVS